MKNSIRKINGNWDDGYVLDKHVLSSTYIGENAYGHAQFDTTRTEVGESLYQLKYRNDWGQVEPLAIELAKSIYPLFNNVGFLIPMPASTARARQPVTALTAALGKIAGKPVFEDLLHKETKGKHLKDLTDKLEKMDVLKDAFTVNDQIEGVGPWNVLVIDDIYDSGATLESACTILRGYQKIRKIYVAALTWK